MDQSKKIRITGVKDQNSEKLKFFFPTGFFLKLKIGEFFFLERFFGEWPEWIRRLREGKNLKVIMLLRGR